MRVSTDEQEAAKVKADSTKTAALVAAYKAQKKGQSIDSSLKSSSASAAAAAAAAAKAKAEYEKAQALKQTATTQSSSYRAGQAAAAAGRAAAAAAEAAEKAHAKNVTASVAASSASAGAAAAAASKAAAAAENAEIEAGRAAAAAAQEQMRQDYERASIDRHEIEQILLKQNQNQNGGGLKKLLNQRWQMPYISQFNKASDNTTAYTVTSTADPNVTADNMNQIIDTTAPVDDTALTLPNVDVKGDNLKNSLIIGGLILGVWWIWKKRKKKRGSKKR